MRISDWSSECALPIFSNSRIPGFDGVRLHDDGRLRLIAWDTLLQFDPETAQAAPPPLRARLDRIELRQPHHARRLLPLQPGQLQVLPPGSGLTFRFGLGTMEPAVEFRYRQIGRARV